MQQIWDSSGIIFDYRNLNGKKKKKKFRNVYSEPRLSARFTRLFKNQLQLHTLKLNGKIQREIGTENDEILRIISI